MSHGFPVPNDSPAGQFIRHILNHSQHQEDRVVCTQCGCLELYGRLAHHYVTMRDGWPVSEYICRLCEWKETP